MLNLDYLFIRSIRSCPATITHQYHDEFDCVSNLCKNANFKGPCISQQQPLGQGVNEKKKEAFESGLCCFAARVLFVRPHLSRCQEIRPFFFLILLLLFSSSILVYVINGVVLVRIEGTKKLPKVRGYIQTTAENTVLYSRMAELGSFLA